MKENKGFTLVEIIIVIAILAVITSITIPIMVNSLKESRLTTDRSNAEILARIAIGVISEDSEIYTEGLLYDFSAPLEPFENEISKELHHKMPTIKSKPGEKFHIKVTSGAVLVFDQFNQEIYPIADVDYQ